MPDYLPLADRKNNPGDYRRAKELRRESSLAERILWHELRLTLKNTGIGFRRQHPIHPYVADFVCLKIRLVIELDGNSHDTRITHDKKRDDYLKNLDYEVMRFKNEDVMANRKGIVQTIMDCALERESSLYTPLP